MVCERGERDGNTYSTDFTKWDRFFISGWPALTLASPSLARAQARRDRRRIGCAQHPVYCVAANMDAVNHVSSRRAGQARSGQDRGRAQLDHIQQHLNSSELI